MILLCWELQLIQGLDSDSQASSSNGTTKISTARKQIDVDVEPCLNNSVAALQKLNDNLDTTVDVVDKYVHKSQSHPDTLMFLDF